MRIQPRPRRGFSLIELLIVITIIITLMGLGTAAAQRALSAAKRVNCLSNLRQLGILLAAYTAGGNPLYPEVATLPSVNPTNLPTLRQTLADGSGSGGAADIFRCPLDTTYYTKEGVSYDYSNMTMANKTYEQVANRRKTSNAATIMVMYDFDPIHGAKFSGQSRHFLYLDGHVGY